MNITNCLFFRKGNISGRREVTGRDHTWAYLLLKTTLTVLMFALVAISVTLPPVGRAAFPGANGKIAFQTFRDGNAEIYAINPDGSGQMRLTNHPATDSVPTWSPNGTKIAFQSDRNGNQEVYVMNADGSNPINLTNNASGDGAPAWSPDGAQIAFTSDREGNQEIYVMNADGSGQVRLTHSPGIDNGAAWSPDGTKIAFITNRDGNDEIYVMNPDGSNQTNLTNHPRKDNSPSWSPDGARIAFYTERVGPPDANFEVFVMNADGSGQTNLSNNGAQLDILPKWSPDGTKIVFHTNRDGNDEVYIMNSDGSNQTNLTNHPAVDGWPDWQPLPIADNSPPIITPQVNGTPGNNGWYISDVSVTWTVTDPESGIASSTGCDPVTLTTDTTSTTLTCSATNGAELSDSASVTIKLDKTPPSITLSSPADGGSYLLNAAVPADYSCADATAGIATCSGPIPSGNNIDTASVGSKSFTVNAADNAGHTASATRTYNVIYNFNGFFPPIDNLPTFNGVKAGQAVPVKFSLSGNQGLNILEVGYPKSQQIECDSSLPVAPVEETTSAGSSSLSYDANADQYVYVWKTDKAWAGTCRQLVVRLIDGTSHLANFNFTK